MKPVLLPLITTLLGAPALAQTCSATSGPTAPRLVELYTSEGCDSCPPAERWLNQLPRDGSVVALAFHVDYWDYLGWRDRFAQAAFTQRQKAQLRVNGSGFAYTPQVVVDGEDRRAWHRSALPPATPASLQMRLWREGGAVWAELQGEPGRQLAAQWWRSEDGLQSAVSAGENRGSLLRHDHVVREGLAVPPFRLAGAQRLRFEPQGPGAVSLLIVDPASGRPVQALRLGC